jgi:uncharacterized membrane protein YedE/YeeE
VIRRLSEFAVGLLFGLGLIVSGMTDPAKVIGFLNLSGNWDPSLAFVMGGAILVGVFAFGFAKRRAKDFFGDVIQWPSSTAIDPRLVGGALLFGVGWGLAGFCPGPALVSMAAGVPKALAFVAAMLVGMFLFEKIERRR